MEDLEVRERFHAQAEQFNSGAPIPSVSVSDVKQLWNATRRMNAELPPMENGATTLTVFAAYGVEAASTRPGEFMAIQWRYSLMSALVERGVLNDYMHGEDFDEKVFRAAATMPCNKNDLGEALIHLKLSTTLSGDWAKAKEEMLAAGCDITKPNIDTKFLDWLRNNC